jgi:hypothetical protein
MTHKEFFMNKHFNRLLIAASKINRQHIQLFFLVLSLGMFVLGAGAPDDGSNVGR